MASGESRVRRPARFSALAGSIATTLVVVELEEFARGTPIVVASTGLDVVVSGVLVLFIATLVDVDVDVVVVDVVVVDVFIVAGRGRIVEFVFEAAFERDVVVSGTVVVG
jgi:uncharacterized membrane protein